MFQDKNKSDQQDIFLETKQIVEKLEKHKKLERVKKEPSYCFRTLEDEISQKKLPVPLYMQSLKSKVEENKVEQVDIKNLKRQAKRESSSDNVVATLIYNLLKSFKDKKPANEEHSENTKDAQS